MAPLLFFSYTHADEGLRNQLEMQLSSLKRQNLISTWHDRRIVAGSHIDEVIDSNLEKAQIILLLVSPDFIGSDYCYGREVQRAIERDKAGAAKVIPVILRPCDWHDLPFGKLRAAPRDGEPITKWDNTDEAFLDVVKSIKTVLNSFEAKGDESTSVDKRIPGTAQGSSSTFVFHRQAGVLSSKLRVALHGGMTYDVANSPDLKTKLMDFYTHLLRELKRRSISINYCGREPLRTVIYDLIKRGYVEHDYRSGLIDDDPRNKKDKLLPGFIHYKEDIDWIRFYWREGGRGMQREPQFFNAIKCAGRESRLWAEYDEADLIVALNGDDGTIHNFSQALSNENYVNHPFKRVIVLGWFSEKLADFHKNEKQNSYVEKVITHYDSIDFRPYKTSWHESPRELALQLATAISDILMTGRHLR